MFVGIGLLEIGVLAVVVLVLTSAVGAQRSRAKGGGAVGPRRADGTRVLCRIPQRGAFAGVCAGFAYTFGWPVWVVRFFAILFVLIGGSGILLYVLLWLLMPVSTSLPDDFDERIT